jgi:hypothetical protein
VTQSPSSPDKKDPHWPKKAQKEAIFYIFGHFFELLRSGVEKDYIYLKT